MESKDKQDQTGNMIRLISILSEIHQLPVALSDLNDNTYIYTSPYVNNYLNNCNATSNGYSSYKENICEKEKELIDEIDNKSKEILTKAYRKNRNSNLRVSYNLKIRQKCGKIMPVNLYISPVVLGWNGNTILKLELYKYIKISGYQRFTLHSSPTTGSNELYYSRVKKKYIDSEMLKLKPVEIQLLKFIASGYTETLAAKKLNIKIDLLRYYKKDIFKKYHVNNTSEAIYVAAQNNLI